MSQFDLIDVPSSNESIRVGSESGGTLVCKKASKVLSIKFTFSEFLSAVQEYSVLLVSFHLQRHMGNFLIQVYGPCVCKFSLLSCFEAFVNYSTFLQQCWLFYHGFRSGLTEKQQLTGKTHCQAFNYELF